MQEQPNVRHLFAMAPSAIPDNTIEAIENLVAERGLEPATTFGGDNPHIRRSNVCWLSDQTWIRDYLYNWVQRANRGLFNFDVENFADIQYTEYSAEDEGHYDWHHDVDFQTPDMWDRKLSLTVQLSDPSEYMGGEFELRDYDGYLPIQSKQKGSVLVFPSYLVHKVNPVLEGKRKSLVLWYEGPRWR
jgi:PKHD-type hydroxylase